MPSLKLTIGDAVITPKIVKGNLASIGDVRVGGDRGGRTRRLRNASARFLPWFDTYDGDIFRTFRFIGVEQRGEQTVIVTKAISDPDATMFRERRDSSGDPCFRNPGWDAPPLVADFRIVFEPVRDTIDGRAFSGFKYWFEYESDKTAIHRLVDRQTWEVGGSLDDVTICLRNWLTPPRMKIGLETTYSTVGLDKWASLLPGNMWARWSLLPGFDMQYGKAGVLLGWFDRMSLIRAAIESNAGENWLRCVDMHGFEQSTSVRTNPKTIAWCRDRLDDVDAANLWTRIHDREQEKACRQLGMNPEPPVAILFSENVWRGMRFDTTYEHVVDVAAEFGADMAFIDPVWEHQQAYEETLAELVPKEKWKGTILEKMWHQNMCVTLDFEVAQVLGGEERLKALCERAGARGIKIISWMATHYSPNSAIHLKKELGHGKFGIFAAKESGLHPDTGYPSSCWTVNLNAPIADRIREQILGVCRRTGLAGFLWDSFSNLGWWQVDYSDGTMRPQLDKMAGLYTDLVNAGLYIMPEAITMISDHSCCGLHGGNIYRGALRDFMYKSSIGPWYDDGTTENYDQKVLKGEMPIDLMFRDVANLHMPSLTFHLVPREQWNAEAVAKIKELFALYKANRYLMKKRTVLKKDAGILWENETGESLLFCLKDQKWQGEAVDAVTGERVEDGKLKKNRAYRLGR